MNWLPTSALLPNPFERRGLSTGWQQQQRSEYQYAKFTCCCIHRSSIHKTHRAFFIAVNLTRFSFRLFVCHERRRTYFFFLLDLTGKGGIACLSSNAETLKKCVPLTRIGWIALCPVLTRTSAARKNTYILLNLNYIFWICKIYSFSLQIFFLKQGFLEDRFRVLWTP